MYSGAIGLHHSCVQTTKCHTQLIPERLANRALPSNTKPRTNVVGNSAAEVQVTATYRTVQSWVSNVSVDWLKTMGYRRPPAYKVITPAHLSSDRLQNDPPLVQVRVVMFVNHKPKGRPIHTVLLSTFVI